VNLRKVKKTDNLWRTSKDVGRWYKKVETEYALTIRHMEHQRMSQMKEETGRWGKRPKIWIASGIRRKSADDTKIAKND
jgi:hypothetical protein